MFRSIALAAATAALALPAFADGHAVDLTATGDAAAGEKAFRGCVDCHVVVNEAGETLAAPKAQHTSLPLVVRNHGPLYLS